MYYSKFIFPIDYDVIQAKYKRRYKDVNKMLRKVLKTFSAFPHLSRLTIGTYPQIYFGTQPNSGDHFTISNNLSMKARRIRF